MIVAPRSQSLAAIMAKATVAARAAAAATLARSGKESTADVWSAVGRDVQVPAAFFTGSEPSGDAATYHRCRVTSHTVCQRWPPTGALAAAYFIEHEGASSACTNSSHSSKSPVVPAELARWRVCEVGVPESRGRCALEGCGNKTSQFGCRTCGVRLCMPSCFNAHLHGLCPISQRACVVENWSSTK